MSRDVAFLVRRAHFNALWRRDPHECVYCGRGLTRRKATIEHLMPRSVGGPNILANMLVACRRCNGRRQSIPLTRWAHAQVMAGHRVQFPTLHARIHAALEEIDGIDAYAGFARYLRDKRRGLRALHRVTAPGLRAELETFLDKKAAAA